MIFLAIFGLLALIPEICAQSQIENLEFTVIKDDGYKGDFPYLYNEKLEYRATREISIIPILPIDRIITGELFVGGELSVRTEGLVRVNGRRCLLVIAEAKPNDLGESFGYKHYRIETCIDLETKLPVWYKNIINGTLKEETFFCYEKELPYAKSVFDDGQTKEVAIPKGTHSTVSVAFWLLDHLTEIPGSEIELSVYHNGKTHPFTIEIRRSKKRNRITLKTEIDVDDPDYLGGIKGRITVWLRSYKNTGKYFPYSGRVPALLGSIKGRYKKD